MADQKKKAAEKKPAKKSEEKESQSQGLVINAQYLKDLSFENPDPVEHFMSQDQNSSSTVNIEVGARHLSEETFEVSLKVNSKAVRAEKTVYLIEVEYAGVFTLAGFGEDMIRLILFVECPRLLFPFARSVIANITQESGFPPLFIKPIDFADLLRKRLEEENKEKKA